MTGPVSEAAPRRHRRKTARPGEIIEAATACFIEAGYGGTKLEDVARKAGIAKGTVYLYFDTKQDLFEAVIRAQVGAVVQDIADLLRSFDGPSEQLLRLAIRRAYDTFAVSDARYIMRIIIGEGQQFPELRKLYYDTSIKQGTETLRIVLQRGVDRGEFRPSQVTRHPQIIMAPCLAASIWSMTFSEFDQIDLDSFMDCHVDLLLNGLRA